MSTELSSTSDRGNAVLVGRTALLEQWSQHLSPELARAEAAARAVADGVGIET